ncbi:MAG: hypothetical protein ACK41T_07825 [Pseudobdellovibrio sp.]
MDEIKFVLKCFVFACLIMVFSQSKINGDTLENKASVFLQYSSTAQWVRDAAEGGIILIRKSVGVTQDFLNNKFDLDLNWTSSNHAKFRRPIYSQTKPHQQKKAQQLGENTAEPSLENDINVIEVE